MPATVDIIVGGRFHSDYMASALLGAGHTVRLFTSFPRNRFPGLPGSVVKPFVAAELAFRAARIFGWEDHGDLWKMRLLGTWAARGRDPVDILFGWSSFCLEAITAGRAGKTVVVRDSAHITVQLEILAREYLRLGLTPPDRSAVARREIDEYAAADFILVPSQFARQSFLDRGMRPEKLHVIALGVNLSLFRPAQRILPRLPLRVIYFGTLSVQKGVHHLLEATRRFSAGEIRLLLVGPVSPEFRPILARHDHFEYRPAMRQESLAAVLYEQDVFVFPTLHDGYGQVLPQAMASGLVPIATDHCGAAELIRDGQNGLVVPAGDAEAIAARLSDLVSDLSRVKHLREAAALVGRESSWTKYSRDLSGWVSSILALGGSRREAGHGG